MARGAWLTVLDGDHRAGRVMQAEASSFWLAARGSCGSLGAKGASAMKRFRLHHAALAAVCAATVLLVGATTEDRRYLTETGITQSSNSAYLYLQGGSACRIFGTFAGASANVETPILGTDGTTDPGNCEIDGGVVVCPVSAAGLRNVVTSSDWVPIDLGFGAYRLAVTGGGLATDLSWHCRVSGA